MVNSHVSRAFITQIKARISGALSQTAVVFWTEILPPLILITIAYKSWKIDRLFKILMEILMENYKEILVKMHILVFKMICKTRTKSIRWMHSKNNSNPKWCPNEQSIHAYILIHKDLLKRFSLKMMIRVWDNKFLTFTGRLPIRFRRIKWILRFRQCAANLWEIKHVLILPLAF